MLYQIIFESDRLLFDQEVWDLAVNHLQEFDIVEARSLDGIRKEVWKQPTGTEIKERQKIANRLEGELINNIRDTQKRAAIIAGKNMLEDLSDLLGDEDLSDLL